MADDRRFELGKTSCSDGLLPEPQTEVMVVVDDSPRWTARSSTSRSSREPIEVLIADEVPVDEARDELLEGFQATYHGGDGRMRAVREDLDDDEDVDDVDEDEETSKSADRVLLGWLAARAIPGGAGRGAVYRRTALLSDGPGIVELRQDGAQAGRAGPAARRVRARYGPRRDRVGLGADPLLRPLLARPRPTGPGC